MSEFIPTKRDFTLLFVFVRPLLRVVILFVSSALSFFFFYYFFCRLASAALRPSRFALSLYLLLSFYFFLRCLKLYFIHIKMLSKTFLFI